MTPDQVIQLFLEAGVRLELGPSGKSVLQRPAHKANPTLLLALRDNRRAVLDELRRRAGLPPRWPPAAPKRAAVPKVPQAAPRPAPRLVPPWAAQPAQRTPPPPPAEDPWPWGVTDCVVCRTVVVLEARPLLGRDGELAYGVAFVCSLCAWTRFRGGRADA